MSEHAVDWAFETGRIDARLVDDRDRALYLALNTDPAVMAHIGPALDEADANAKFEKVCGYNAEWPLRARYWQLSDRRSGDAIGVLSVIRDASDAARIELGMMFLPTSQSAGYAAHITREILDRLFDDGWALGIETVVARHAPTNDRVSRLGVTLGFEHVAAGSQTLNEWRMRKAQWLAQRTV
jgi:RimJ/RimL family protein N-acetyltransferase